jgi:prepilin-type N-terminal cleavage/methylation domain-containing protein
MKRNQSGFTLIEIAIVLVIIGLLLGGVLKGQELINSAKVKNLANDFKNVPVFIYGYQDKFKALPGDQIQGSLDGQFSGATASTTTAKLGNGIIDGKWNDTTTASESFVFWQHVRLAGFGPGSTNTADADYRPKNAVGGYIGITNALTDIPITGMKGTYVVCSDSIPGKFAKQLDITLDDGHTDTGSVLVSGGSNPPAPAPTKTADIVDDQTYLVCMGY